MFGQNLGCLSTSLKACPAGQFKWTRHGKQYEVLSGAVDVEVKVTLDLARVCFNTVRKKWYLSVTS